MLRKNPRPKFKTPRLRPANIKWIYELLPNLSNEVGGAIELDKNGHFSRFTIYTGSEQRSMILPDFLQIEFHTHQDPFAVQLPSITDLRIAMKRKLGYSKGDKGVSGQVNVVFARPGVIVYRYTSKEPTNNAGFDKINNILQAGSDKIEGIKQQIEDIQKVSPFRIQFTPWTEAMSRGVSLGRLCLKEIVVDEKP